MFSLFESSILRDRSWWCSTCLIGSFFASGRLEGLRLDGKIDLGVRVALLLVEETVDMTDGGAFLWKGEEEDGCLGCLRRVPPREGIVGNCRVNRPCWKCRVSGTSIGTREEMSRWDVSL